MLSEFPLLHIVDDLRARILSLDLLPGAPLSRAKLGTRYGLSSTPIRDALLRLQAEGLVIVRPQARTSVSLIDLDKARQVHFLRSAVEVEMAGRLAETPRPKLLAEMSSLLDLQDQARVRGNLTGFAMLDAAFHETMFRHARLPDLHRLIRRESVHVDRLRALHLMQPEKAAQILADHQKITWGISASDPLAASQAMRIHLSQSILWAERLTEQKPEFFTVTARHDGFET